jgi:hypothetical protein
MDCIEFRKILLLHVDRRLSLVEEREFNLHREACPCCDRRASYEERFQTVLRERLTPAPAPAGLRKRVLARLAREGRCEREQGPGSRWGKGPRGGPRGSEGG